MRFPALLVLLLLSQCSTPPPQVPAELQVCPDSIYAPSPPPSPRTVKALFDWAKKTELARQKSEQARKICSGRLDRLNLWILKHSTELR